MSKITNTKIYAVLWLSSQGKDNSSIASELKLSEQDIEQILSENTPKSTVAKSTSNNMMITHTAGKKANTVAIMTKEASQYNDELKKQSVTSNKSSRDLKNSIYRPKSK